MKRFGRLTALCLTAALAASTALTVCASDEGGTIKVAASTVPHAEILAEAAKLLEDKGWTLEVTEFTDYVQPNLVVESGEFDANYFQHVPYLDQFNIEKSTHLAVAGRIHCGGIIAERGKFEHDPVFRGVGLQRPLPSGGLALDSLVYFLCVLGCAAVLPQGLNLVQKLVDHCIAVQRQLVQNVAGAGF